MAKHSLPDHACVINHFKTFPPHFLHEVPQQALIELMARVHSLAQVATSNQFTEYPGETIYHYLLVLCDLVEDLLDLLKLWYEGLKLESETGTENA